MLEIVFYIAFGYLLLLGLLEVIIWRTQPDMEGGVTLHVNMGDTIETRKLYGLEYNNVLYVASNHWFRSWYHALLVHPYLDVERDGEIAPYTATPVEGEELVQVAREYNMSFALRLACGFAPQRFLRLEPRKA